MASDVGSLKAGRQGLDFNFQVLIDNNVMSVHVKIVFDRKA